MVSEDHHSKLCLRRMSSRATLFTSTDRHSRICVRSQAKTIRSRLRTIIDTFRKGQQIQNYLTGRLPPEIRLIIYSYLLQFDVPIRLEREPRHWPRLKGAGILLVNRLTYMEALPVLHQQNTIVISRDELCQLPTYMRPQLSCKPDLVQSLYLSNLHPSSRCAASMNRIWPAWNWPCNNCKPSILGLINSIQSMPRIRQVFIDYFGHNASLRALAEGLKACPGIANTNRLQLVCTGIGKYKLTGDWLHGVKFELCDAPLTEIWSRVTALPSPQPILPYYRANRAMWKDLRR